MLALLLNAERLVDVKALAEWATEVRREAPRLAEAGDEWTPGDPAAWSTARGIFGRLVQPIKTAILYATGDVFEQVAMAIKVMRLPGHRNDLQARSSKK